MSNTNTITITVGELEFEFGTKQQWIWRSPEIWREHELKGEHAICVDAKGRVCEMGKHFQRAEDDGAYPIKVYRKNPRNGRKGMTDPSTGPIPREKFAELVNAPFGAAKKVIQRYDHDWGRAPGEKFQWLVRVERSGSDQGRAWVEAASQEEADQLAAKISPHAIDWDYDDDGFTVVSVEPDKR